MSVEERLLTLTAEGSRIEERDADGALVSAGPVARDSVSVDDGFVVLRQLVAPAGEAADGSPVWDSSSSRLRRLRVRSMHDLSGSGRTAVGVAHGDSLYALFRPATGEARAMLDAWERGVALA